MTSFVCEVCLEAKLERLDLPPLNTGNGDVLRAGDCGHGICRECMAGYVTARVEEQRVFHVRCPHESCRNEQDLRRLVDAGVLPSAVRDRFVELRARDFTARAKSFSEVLPPAEQDLDLVWQLWDTTRFCPRCSLVIEKSSGCDSFYCICGEHFNYQGAPRAVGNGVKRYGKIISLARLAGMPLREAEKYNVNIKAYWKAGRIADQLGLPLDSEGLEAARTLLGQAQAGDEAARARIREGRRAAAAGQRQDGARAGRLRSGQSDPGGPGPPPSTARVFVR